MKNKTAIIIGAGPAGLTAAYELLKQTDITPMIFETDHQVGGISKTVAHNGNRMDLGGHRFFSKSDWVMNWWQNILPIHSPYKKTTITYQSKQRTVLSNPDKIYDNAFMSLRPRLSRIYFLRKFFDYPIKLNINTIANLGFTRIIRIGLSYTMIRLRPRKPELNLEDFIINRFGRELYLTFFKDYTEKVWGIPCDQISAEWGAQRIKGLSITAALRHALYHLFRFLPRKNKLPPKKTETSLIEQFLYPQLGPGQMWETVANQICAEGGTIELGWKVTGLQHQNGRITDVYLSGPNNETKKIQPDYVISTMPVRDLILGLLPAAPQTLRNIATALPYRSFITVGVLVKQLKPRPDGTIAKLPDNWIYIQEKDVKLGRLQIFNNWSQSLVADASTIWLGLEYFCNEDDDLWQMGDVDFTSFAIKELAKIALINAEDVLDSHIVRVPKAYPAYFGAYSSFGQLREYIDKFSNLFLIGRNGMHRYNNQDHSMLTAKLAVETIAAGRTDKSAIWAVNVDDEYHETKTS